MYASLVLTSLAKSFPLIPSKELNQASICFFEYSTGTIADI